MHKLLIAYYTSHIAHIRVVLDGEGGLEFGLLCNGLNVSHLIPELHGVPKVVRFGRIQWGNVRPVQFGV